MFLLADFNHLCNFFSSPESLVYQEAGDQDAS